jgi:hypothetical protein
LFCHDAMARSSSAGMITGGSYSVSSTSSCNVYGKLSYVTT